MSCGWAGNLAAIALLCFFMGFAFEVGFMIYHQPHQDGGKQQQAKLRALYHPRPHDGSKIIEKIVEVEKIVHVTAPCQEERRPEVNTSNRVDLIAVLNNVPPIVEAWRNAKLDWHSLLPSHNSKWERFGTPQGEGKLRLLVGKEEQITDYLTRFEESGMSSLYGHDHGPLNKYSACDVFSSACMAHDQEGCSKDEMCHWSQSETVCRDVLENPDSLSSATKPMSCSDKVFMVLPDRGMQAVTDHSQCKAYVSNPAVIVNLDSEAQSMFYHWWAAWQSVYRYWKQSLSSSRDVHFFLPDVVDPMFFHYFGLLSDNCWRRMKISSAMASRYNGVCFCDVRRLRASQSRADAEGTSKQMLSYLGLSEVTPPKNRVKIGIISRRKKRFILNEYELVKKVEEMGYDCELLPLERMTLYEQMRALRSVDVLVGIHGSALDNSAFLHPNSVMVQLLPFSVEHRVTFQSTAAEAHVIYQEWQLKDQTKAVFHWDLLDQANSAKLQQMTKEQILAQGQRRADNRETTMFWINQDIIVPVDEWEEIIRKAVAASPAKARGLV